MNIIEAIKKYPNNIICLRDDLWINVEMDKHLPVFLNALSEEDFLSNNWAIREKQITLTKSQFLDTVSETMKKIAVKYSHSFLTPKGPSDTPYDVTGFEGWTELIKKLGFDEVKNESI